MKKIKFYIRRRLMYIFLLNIISYNIIFYFEKELHRRIPVEQLVSTIRPCQISFVL